MAIGSSFNYPADLAAQRSRSKRSQNNKWRGRFPNPPDLCFDYRTLVELDDGIANATEKNHKICIIGAGITGLTTARELYRCGFTNITLLEKSKRIGGRHLTVLGNHNSNNFGRPPFEMGAMRMPFFNRSNEQPSEGRSLMAYYANEFNLLSSDFPNPGSPWVKSTGIYLREGTIDKATQPTMLLWKNENGTTSPPGEELGSVYTKWKAFAERLTQKVEQFYGNDQWEFFWSAIVKRYESISFRDLVKTPTISDWSMKNPGDFGGMGMTAQESAIFYAIGIGDGSWGAFYDICSLYPLRTAIFGFSSHLQLIHGRVRPDHSVLDSPYLHSAAVFDSKGLRFNKPNYIGLAALAECLLFMKHAESEKSLYDHLRESDNGLLTDSTVTKLTKLPNNKIRVSYDWRSSSESDTEKHSDDFDSVVMTLPSWLIETQIKLENFDQEMLPFDIINAYKTAHWETSCKIYDPLKKPYFQKTPRSLR